MDYTKLAEKYGGTTTKNYADIASKYGGSLKVEDAPQTSSVPFPASANDTGLQAGLKALGNTPSSAFNLAKGAVSAITNPIQTIKGVGSVAMGGVQKLIPEEQGQEDSFNAFAKMLKERYGSLEALQKTATEDPFAFGTDLLGVVGGVAGLTGKTSQLNRAITATGDLVVSPISKATGAISNKVSGATKFSTSQITGLNPETISELLKNPNKFKNLNPEIRVETARSIADALDERLSELSDLGKGYEAIRASDTIIPIPEGSVQNILDKYKVQYIGGKIKTTAESVPLSSADKTELAEFLNTYGNEPIMSGNSILNARAELSRISQYDKAKTGNLQRIARDIRGVYDTVAKRSIPELPQLDRQYGPEKTLLSQLKKDIFTPQGELKDTAISKIANLTGKGKEAVLERVKQIVPDIEDRVKLLKAVEDIERTSGIKVGTYSRTATQILGGTGIATGNIPAIITAIIAQPEIAVPLLRGAGYIGQKAVPILNALKTIASDVNSFTLPTMTISGPRQ